MWVAPYLAALAEHGIRTDAALVAKIDRVNVWRREKSDPEFAALVEEAMEQAADKLEREARRRAIEGVEEPVYQGGQLVGTKLVFSDNMLGLLLKGRRKKVFADRTEITGADGGAIKHADETSRSARVAQLIELARIRKEAEDLA